MTRVPMKTLLEAARTEQCGLAAFNVIHLETAEALVRAAERRQRPLVLQISQNCVQYHGALGPLARATLALADSSSADLCVHLDHASDLNLIDEAIALGFDSVMYDGSKLSDVENIATTYAVVQKAHEHAVAVEAEIGEIGGKNGVHDPRTRTDPEDARGFQERTGVDALAVAVGSSHAMTDTSAVLDTGLIQRIHSCVAVPLVLHGSSGVSDSGIRAAIRAGMTKINVSTRFSAAFVQTLRGVLLEHPGLVDSRKAFGPARDRLQTVAESVMDVIALADGEVPIDATH